MTMAQIPTVGFLGLGEDGFHIARGLIEAGIPSVPAFDIHQDTPGRGDIFKTPAATAGATLVAHNPELAGSCNLILSTVTADRALIAARQTAPYLTARHTYADMNSVSPVTKQAIALTTANTGAVFVEVAIMAPVPPHGHKDPLFAGGPDASDFITLLSPFGIRAEAVKGPIGGAAAATRMCRSIMVKGLEAVITECMPGASFYGADERVAASLSESFPGIDRPALADYMTGPLMLHGQRRAREMEEAAETLRAADVDPIMTEAIIRRMDRSVEAVLPSHFGGESPKGYRDVGAGLWKANAGAR
jgi:3-hydroxyisobutyrate dehydrogenase-like beta-hydroxyacid dehydrogenase